MLTTSDHILVLKDEEQMVSVALQKFIDFYREAIQREGRFVVALSGGSSPKKFYQALADCQQIEEWDKIHVFLVDERFVPLSNDESNYRMIKEKLLDRVGLPEENRHYVPFLETVKDSAAEYEKDLQDFFRDKLPEFDLIMLGMGTDGHTASLFPGSIALQEETRWVMPVAEPDVNYERVTLTYPVINNAKQILFYVMGEAKAEKVEAVIKGTDESLPSAHVVPEKGELFFILDTEAAEGLSDLNSESR